MSTFVPILDVLPPALRTLWERLGATPAGFVLYGGPAVALRLGHRQTGLLDFFSARSFEPSVLMREVPYLAGQTVTHQAADALSCEVVTEAGIAKLNFFGSLSLRQIEPPDTVTGNGLALASLRDLFGTKCVAIVQRREARDYLDIHALIHSGGLSMSEGIACALAIHGGQAPEAGKILEALSRFDDLPTPLDPALQAGLREAAGLVVLDRLPRVAAGAAIGEI